MKKALLYTEAMSWKAKEPEQDPPDNRISGECTEEIDIQWRNRVPSFCQKYDCEVIRYVKWVKISPDIEQDEFRNIGPKKIYGAPSFSSREKYDVVEHGEDGGTFSSC